MIYKSIRLLHARIGLVLKWNWFLFFLANLILLIMFILTNFLGLKESSKVWKEFFLDRLNKVENIIDSGGQSSTITVLHTLTIGFDGTIRKSPTPILEGMRLNKSGFFGKIYNLQPGQITIIFFPDMVDGVQRVHFVKRYADEFIVNSFSPKDFFPISLASKTKLAMVTGDVIWFSDDSKQIGNIYKNFPIYIDSCRLYISFVDQIPDMPEALLVISQDITDELLILFLTASILMVVFTSVSMQTIRIQKDLTLLQDEQMSIMQLIKSLSAVIFHVNDNVSARLENLTFALQRTLQDSGERSLQFEEHQQYLHLVKNFIDNIVLLVDLVKKERVELRESAEKFRQIFDESPIGIEVFDADGSLLKINRACLDIFGIGDGNEVIGFNLFDERNLPTDAKKHLYLEGSVFYENQLDFDWLRANNLYRTSRSGIAYFETIINALSESDGFSHGYLVQIQDITKRKQAELAHQDSEDRFRSLSEATFEAIVITENGKVFDANQQFMQMWGYDMSEVLGKHLTQFMIPEQRDILQQVIASGKEIVREYCALRKDGTQFFIESHGRVIEHSQRKLRVTSIRNITERKQAEELMLKSEEKFSKVFLFAPGAISINDLHENCNFIDINESFQQITGYDRDDVIGHTSEDIGLYVDPQMQEQVTKRIQTNVRIHNLEYHFRKKNGQVGIGLLSTEVIEIDGRPCAIISTIDITELKHTKEQLEDSLKQLHALSSHLQTIREKERATIAREIHDELGQALTGLKMELFWLKNIQAKTDKVEYSNLVEEKLTSALKDIDTTIDLVRTIATSLRPSILDTLGLIPALEWLVNDFKIRTGIVCLFKASLKREDFSQKFATAAFRICQESLTNVARHAHASHVKVHLYAREEYILLEVEDNGCGIIEEKINWSNSLGILGMKERAYSFNGSVDFKNSRTGGTRVISRFPEIAVFHPKE